MGDHRTAGNGGYCARLPLSPQQQPVSSTQLAPPPLKRPGVIDWVASNLTGLFSGPSHASEAFVGGQQAADAALAGFDVTGYAARRNEVLPEDRRGASKLSPYIRHGLLPLRRVWDHVAGGPARDVRKFRFELLWQEYARHWYATYRGATRDGVRYRQAEPHPDREPWPEDMLCIGTNLEELHGDGWLVNQTRMWLASQWAVRHDAPWRDGEDWFFRHLLDGSRAANRLGWQWTVGLSKQKVYGFSRRQVLQRAPGLCVRCPHDDDCPISGWPETPPRHRTPEPSDPEDPTQIGGPAAVDGTGDPDVVWLTAESMGDADPALAAHPDLPVVFVFDEPLLRTLRLAAKRLVFLAETLADLSRRRIVEIHLGRPAAVLAERRPAVTFAPVPGFRRIAGKLELAEIHPYPWLRRPDGGSVASFSQWNRRGGQHA